MAGHNNWPYIVNLGNSIIGVAVLAMPFCFKQCGILLGMIVLLFCTWLTLVSCHLLMRAGIHSRRRSYEFLAYHTHGATGKLLSELGMIGMQVGTLIAQIVVIGDLGPAIFSKFLGIENTSGLRLFLILALCLGVGLPLGLLKDIRAVSRASTVCISFYCIFILYVIGLSLPNIKSGEWYQKVSFWRPEGFFQCLPILSFSFGCQTQLFLLYDALPDPSLKAINGVISSAVNLCAVAYLLVGFFGYVAFHDIDVPGDVISVFPNTFSADVMKICFVFSIVITFPVIIFPCRSSIYTLVFAKKTKAHDDSIMDSDGYLPEKLFKGITVFIVISCMILGILIPNVEFVLGINGAIMGTLICYIFPALFFLKVMGNKQDSRGMAQIVFIFGVTILLLSTFATLSSQGNGEHQPQPVELNNLAAAPMLPRDIDGHLAGPIGGDGGKVAEQLPKPLATQLSVQNKEDGKDGVVVKDDVRQEPPNPDPPDVKPAGGMQEKIKEAVKDSEPLVKKDPPIVIESPVDNDNKDDKKMDKEIKEVEDIAKAADANKAKELELQEKEKKQDELLQQLEKHREEQEKLIEEQRQLLKEFKDHHEKDLKNELDQEKDKLQQQLKQEAIQGKNVQQAQPAGGQEDGVQHLQPAGGHEDIAKHVQPAGGQEDIAHHVQPAGGQRDDGQLKQAARPQQDDSQYGQLAAKQGGNMNKEQPAQLRVQQDSVGFEPVGKVHKEQQLRADLQEPLAKQQQKNLLLDNQPDKRADIDPQLHADHMKNSDDTGGRDIVPGIKQKKPVVPDNLEPPAAAGNVVQQQQLLQNQDQQLLREADNLRQANLNLGNDVAQLQNQQQQRQQPLVKESDPLNVPNHPQQPQIFAGARHDEQVNQGGRSKRSADDQGMVDQHMSNDTKVDINKIENDRAREHVGLMDNKQKDVPAENANVVQMDVESALAKDDKLNSNLMKNQLDEGNTLKLGEDVKESAVVDREIDKVGDKKRNEEMRRKLKSLNSDEKFNSINAEFIQPLANDIKGVVDRHLLEYRGRD